MTIKNNKLLTGMITAGLFLTPNAFAEEDAEAIAKKLANPIANMISLPLQLNYDSDMGETDKGSKYTLNVQPVIPISMNDEWNLITRTIMPIVWQSDTAVDASRSSGLTGSQSGMGNITFTAWASPKEPTESGWIWGVGPVVLLPTASDDLIGGEQWGLGPTAIVLKQDGHFTYGGLANHIWSVAQDTGAPISSTFIQPFFVYGDNGISYTLNSESTYDWEREEWSIPVNAFVSKVMKWGNQMVQVGGGVRYWASSTETGPEGWGARLQLTFVFPK